ncbi:MAG: hypothetical protein IJ256_01850 [Bacteroidaceae bacterium]|nr:hypothetical protein [Bacteroidaceae bacterium]
MVSQGSLKPVKVANATVSGNAVNFAWTNNAGSGEALASDIAIVLAFNKDDGEAEYVTNAGVRGDGQCQLALPSGWEEASLAVYLGFRNADTGNWADSLCLINTRAEGSSSGNQSSGSQSSGSNSAVVSVVMEALVMETVEKLKSDYCKSTEGFSVVKPSFFCLSLQDSGRKPLSLHLNF